jgi:hypothetical protein
LQFHIFYFLLPQKFSWLSKAFRSFGDDMINVT